MKRLFLIDGSALAYRAHFAFAKNPLRNSRGEDTSAAFGVTSAILRLMKEHHPDLIAVAFDTPKPTFRHERFEAYKAKRRPMPREMVLEMPLIKEILESLGLSVVEMEGYEADDVLATLAKQGEEKGYETVIVSGDKDFLQLVSDRVKVLKPRVAGGEEVLYDLSNVQERFGVPPEQVVEVMGLAGDSTDNVPGVPGVGEKTALELIKQFGSVENILANAGQITKKSLREKILEHVDLARMSRELVALHTDCPVGVQLDELKPKDPDKEKVASLFKRMEFLSLLRDIWEEKAEGDQPGIYKTLDSLEGLISLVEEVRKTGEVVIDLETTGTDPITSEIVGISLAVKAKEAYYIPVAHAAGKNLEWGVTKSHLKPILEEEGIAKVGQNIKYDLTVLREAGIDMKGITFDTMVASYLLAPSRRANNLNSMALEFLGHRMITYEEVTGKGKLQMSFAKVSIDKATEYSGEDADYTLRLKELFEPQLKEKELRSLFQNVEMPLVSVLATMERNGVAIDRDFFRGMSRDIEKVLVRLEKEIHALAGETFNINSPKQLSEILFTKLKLGKAKRTKSGSYSTDVDVLKRLARAHELPRKLLDYRALFKLKSTYVDALIGMINSRTQRIHTSFNQTVAETGRLSSSEPNLQNIPIRDEYAREIRKGFIADKGNVILSGDYSQIELRLVAHLSKDEHLREAFARDEDVHTTTASTVFGLKPEEVSPDLRRRAKAINFGIIYGMGPYGLSEALGISQEEAAAFIASYFLQYPKIKTWIDRTIAEARDRGYVTTLLSRRRYLPEIASDNHQRRSFAERAAINTPIQGTAADLIKMAMIAIQKRIEGSLLRTKMILQVHDELVFEVPEAERESIRDMLKEEMEGTLSLDVPIKVEVREGRNWYEAH